ncbi:hypothetical protein ACNKHS_05275 [Shigella flexneri]
MSQLNEKLATAWEGFTRGDLQNEGVVAGFIRNHTPYARVTSLLLALLKPPPPWRDKVMEGVKLESAPRARVHFDTAVASTITSHDAGYISKQLEKKSLVCRLKLR